MSVMITMALLLSNSESAYRLPQNRKLTTINVTQFDVIIIPVKARMSSANKAVNCGAPARVLFLSCSLIAALLSPLSPHSWLYLRSNSAQKLRSEQPLLRVTRYKNKINTHCLNLVSLVDKPAGDMDYSLRSILLSACF